MDDAFEHAVRLVEAFVFASAEPVAESAVGRLVPMPCSAREVLEALRDRCEGRGVHLVEVGGGCHIPWIVRLGPGSDLAENGWLLTLATPAPEWCARAPWIVRRANEAAGGRAIIRGHARPTETPVR